MLFGLTHEARAALPAQFRRLEPCKTYLALARGTALPDSVQARQPIGTVPHGPLTVWCARSDGKPAHPRIRVLERDVSPGRGGQFLHASALRFEHPTTQCWVKVRATAPWL